MSVSRATRPVWMLLGLALGCRSTEPAPQSMREDNPIQTGVVSSSTPTTGVADFDALLESRIDGWSLDPAADRVLASRDNPPDLERRCKELMAGDCEQLMRFGLSQLLLARFTDNQIRPAHVELRIARFGSAEGAWSFMTQRVLQDVGARDSLHPAGPSAGERADPVGAPSLLDGPPIAVLDGTHVVAVDARDVIELRYSDRFRAETDSLERAGEALPRLLLEWTSRSAATSEVPTALALLPKDKRVPFGLRFFWENALGVRGGGPAALGYYSDGDREYSLFVASYPEEASAKDAASVLRGQPGRRILDDASFDAFELSRPPEPDAPALLWLIGQYGRRVVGVGSAMEPPASRAVGGKRYWLERSEKMTLMRRLMAKREPKSVAPGAR